MSSGGGTSCQQGGTSLCCGHLGRGDRSPVCVFGPPVRPLRLICSTRRIPNNDTNPLLNPVTGNRRRPRPLWHVRRAASPVVRIFAFQAKEPSSILGRRTSEHAPMAQWITRPPTERKIPGSTPGRCAYFFFLLFNSVFSILQPLLGRPTLLYLLPRSQRLLLFQ